MGEFFKKNNIWLGTAIGLQLPLLLYVLFDWLKTMHPLYVKDGFLNVVCIGVNFLIFRYYVKKEIDKTAQGVLLATFLYAFLFFYWYFNIRTIDQ